MRSITMAWKGIYLLGISFGISALWFVVAWVQNDSMPLFQRSAFSSSFSDPSLPILPPVWLSVVLGLLVAISFVMMVVGTQQGKRSAENQSNK